MRYYVSFTCSACTSRPCWLIISFLLSRLNCSRVTLTYEPLFVSLSDPSMSAAVASVSSAAPAPSAAVASVSDAAPDTATARPKTSKSGCSWAYLEYLGAETGNDQVKMGLPSTFDQFAARVARLCGVAVVRSLSVSLSAPGSLTPAVSSGHRLGFPRE